MDGSLYQKSDFFANTKLGNGQAKFVSKPVPKILNTTSEKPISSRFLQKSMVYFGQFLTPFLLPQVVAPSRFLPRGRRKPRILGFIHKLRNHTLNFWMEVQRRLHEETYFYKLITIPSPKESLRVCYYCGYSRCLCCTSI